MSSTVIKTDSIPINNVVNLQRAIPTSEIEVVQHPCQLTFKEDPNQIQDEDEYQRSGTDAGLVVIFNQESYDSSRNIEKRVGTNTDVNELILTFGRLGFNIERQHIHNNLKRKEILEVINNLSKADYSDKNCLIVIMLTHGDEDNILETYDAPISASEIWQPFSNNSCQSFKNKPKFFIFQACKGHEYSRIDKIPENIIPRYIIRQSLEADMLIAFSSVENAKSCRNIVKGSWFIQELCRNFNAYGRRDDVVTLLLRVTKCVANGYYHLHEDDNSEKILGKQMPLFISTLSKKFYLTYSKDRKLLMYVKKQQKLLTKTIKELKL
ncbi:hypothetical protein FQA39_LY16011 [Lamprigera yunnana]|nr:hypothetical protein FQA39_LY16011 [Lamprigera yunnana]